MHLAHILASNIIFQATVNLGHDALAIARRSGMPKRHRRKLAFKRYAMSLLPKICIRKWTGEQLHMLEDMTWGVQSHSPKSSLIHLLIQGFPDGQTIRESYPQCWTSVRPYSIIDSCGMEIPKGLDPPWPGLCTGVMKVSAAATTQTLSWIFTAGLDTQCTAPCMQWTTKRRYGINDHRWNQLRWSYMLDKLRVLRVTLYDSNKQEGQNSSDCFVNGCESRKD